MSSFDMQRQPAAQSKDDEFVVGELFRMIGDQIWWVLGITLSVLFAAILFARLSTPIYSADALVQVDTPTPNASSSNQSASAAALLPSGGSLQTDAEIEIIKSRAVIEPVIRQFKMNVVASPRTFPVLGHASNLFSRTGEPLRAPLGLRSYAWGGERFKVDDLQVPVNFEDVQLTLRALGDGRYRLVTSEGTELLRGQVGETATGNGFSLRVSQLDARPGTEFYVAQASALEAVQNFGRAMQVSEKGKETGIIDIAYNAPDPALATAVANALAASYLRQRTERAQEEATRMLTFLSNELPRVRNELHDSETALAQSQQSAGSFQPTQEAQTYLSGGLDYERQIAALRMQRVQLMQRYTEGADEVRAVDAQLAALNVEKSRFEEQFKTLPGSERKAVSLEREAKVNSEIYVALLNRTQELAISRAGTVGNVHIIDHALLPSQPVAPKKPMITAAGGLIGLFAGVLFAFVRRSYFAGVSDPALVERRFNMPVFSAIPFSAEQARLDRIRLTRPMALPGKGQAGAHVLKSTAPDSLLSTSHPYDPAIEGLRGFRAMLQFALVDAPNRVIAITSPAPHDGKSFVSANLAAMLAESGARVLLIDADLRRGRLARYLGTSPHGGLTELLTGRTDFHMAAQETGVRGLHFIGAGTFPPNPSEILTSARFAALLKAFEKQFDLVIVDTPPLLAVPDAAVIASLAGSTVLILRAGAHSEQNIAQSLKKLHRARSRIVGSVINAMPFKKGKRNGNYDYAYAHTYLTPHAAKRR